MALRKPHLLAPTILALVFLILMACTFRTWRVADTGSRNDSSNLSLTQSAFEQHGASHAHRPSNINLPFAFEANRGQIDPRVKFVANAPGYEVFLTSSGMTLAARRSNPVGTERNQSRERDILEITFSGRARAVSGVEELPGKINYLVGNRNQWHTDVPRYRKVKYEEIFPGVDLTYHGSNGQFESDFVVAPRHDPREIMFSVKGGVCKLSPDGDVLIQQASGASFHLRKPTAYQLIAGVRKEISSAYSLDRNHVRFSVGPFDSSQTLVIDPVVVYSTYLGGLVTQVSGGAYARSIAVDSSGASYVAGLDDNDQSFPVTPGAIQQNLSQGFISKIDASGTTLVYSAAFSADIFSIAVDGSGEVYAAASANPGFPTTQGAFQPTSSPNASPLIFKLNSAGSDFIYATYLHGSGTDEANAIAIDGAGDAYVVGSTSSNDFPTLNPLQAGNAGNTDGFITKINPAGTALIYSTYLGGSALDQLSSVAVDGSGNAHVTGYSLSTNFPVSNAFQGSLGAPSGTNAIVAALSPTGNTLIYSTYLGGMVSGGNGIAVDSSGNASVVGTVQSCDFPLQNAIDTTCGGTLANPGGFVAKFSPSGSVVFSTYFGVQSAAQLTSVATDTSGDVYFTGFISLGGQVVNGVVTGAGYPLKNAVQSSVAPIVLSELDPTGSALLFSTYFGSASNPSLSLPGATTFVNGAAVDASGNIYVAGGTSLGLPVVSALYPVLPGGFDTLHDLTPDVFVFKVSPAQAAAAGLMPAEIDFGDQPVSTTSSAQTFTLADLGSSALGITSITATGDYQQTNDCGTGLAAAASCTVTVTFTPSAAGARPGGITITDSAAGSPQTVALTGTGALPAVNLNPTSLTFLNQPVSASSPAQTISLTNTGDATLSISQLSVTGDFAENNTCGTTVASQSTCQINVTFTPTASGPRSGTLSIVDNAAGSPQTVGLSGNPAASFSISPGSGSPTATVTSGQTATYNLTINGSNGFSGQVHMSCSGAPAESSCSVSPNPVTVGGASGTSLMVTVSTKAASVSPLAWVGLPNLPNRLAFPFLILLPALAVILFRGRVRPFWSAVRGGLGIAVLMFCVGCGGSSRTEPTNLGTPTGQYTVVVMGTSGSITQSMNLTLVVN